MKRIDLEIKQALGKHHFDEYFHKMWEYLEDKRTLYLNDLVVLYSFNNLFSEFKTKEVLYPREIKVIEKWIFFGAYNLLVSIENEQNHIHEYTDKEVSNDIKKLKAIEIISVLERLRSFISKYPTYYSNEINSIIRDFEVYQQLDKGFYFEQVDEIEQSEQKLDTKVIEIQQKLFEESKSLRSDLTEYIKLSKISEVSNFVYQAYQNIINYDKRENLKELESLFNEINEDYYKSKITILNYKNKEASDKYFKGYIDNVEYFEAAFNSIRDYVGFIFEIRRNTKHIEDRIEIAKNNSNREKALQEYIEELKKAEELLSDAELDKIFPILMKVANNYSEEIKTEIIVIKSQYSKYKKSERLRTESNENLNIRYNQIVFSINGLLEQLEIKLKSSG